MEKPIEMEPQPFFLVVNRDTGEILCAHQEYSAEGRRLLSRCRDTARVVDIAMKANPACERVKAKLEVHSVTCSPTLNFSRHTFDKKRASLVPRRLRKKTPAQDSFDTYAAR